MHVLEEEGLLVGGEDSGAEEAALVVLLRARNLISTVLFASFFWRLGYL